MRWRDGLIFGALLVAGAVATALLRRLPRPRVHAPAFRRRARGRPRCGVRGRLHRQGRRLGGDRQRGRPPRDTSSNFRFIWWRRRGTASSLTALGGHRRRHVRADQPALPHDVSRHDDRAARSAAAVPDRGGHRRPAAPLLAAAALLRPVWRRPRGHELALALLLPAYLVHGARRRRLGLRGRLRSRRSSPPARLRARLPSVASALFALLAGDGRRAARLRACCSCPWLGNRWATRRTRRRAPARAVTLANRAHCRRPVPRRPVLGPGARGRRARAGPTSHSPCTSRPSAGSRGTRRPGSPPASTPRAPLLPVPTYDYSRALHRARPEGAPSAGGAVYNEALDRVEPPASVGC